MKKGKEQPRKDKRRFWLFFLLLIIGGLVGVVIIGGICCDYFSLSGSLKTAHLSDQSSVKYPNLENNGEKELLSAESQQDNKESSVSSGGFSGKDPLLNIVNGEEKKNSSNKYPDFFYPPIINVEYLRYIEGSREVTAKYPKDINEPKQQLKNNNNKKDKNITSKEISAKKKNKHKNSPKKPRVKAKNQKKSLKPINKSDKKQIGAKISGKPLSDKTIDNTFENKKGFIKERKSTDNGRVSGNQDWVDSAFDFFVGGKYFGYIEIKYNDSWVEIKNPEKALDLLPLVNDRQKLLPLFMGKIFNKKSIKDQGEILVDHDNFSIYVTISPSQSVKNKNNKSITKEYEGSKSLITSLSAKGSKPLRNREEEGRVSLSHATRISYNQYRVISDSVIEDLDEDYNFISLRAESDLMFGEKPFTIGGGLLNTLGLPFASSVDLVGLSLKNNRELYSNDPKAVANKLKIYVPTRAKVEIFKNSADTGQILFSRMMDFGHQEINTNGFPRGSYDVVIVISANNIELERYSENFYKYDEIVPKEYFDIDVVVGKARDETEMLDTDIGFGSIRLRLKDYLEGTFAIYKVGNAEILSQGLKGIISFEEMGEFRFEGSVSEILSEGLLGKQLRFDWNISRSSLSLLYSRSFNKNSIMEEDLTILSFPERERMDFIFSKNFTVNDNNLNFNFHASQRKDDIAGETYRYGPQLKYTAFRDINSSLQFSASYEKTDNGDDVGFFINYQYRDEPIRTTSTYKIKDIESSYTQTLTNYITYDGKNSDHEYLKNFEAKGVVTATVSDLEESEDQENYSTNLEAKYTGQYFNAGVYSNYNFADQDSGNFGGEITSTFVYNSGKNFHVTNEIPWGSGLVAITLSGDEKINADISIKVDNSHKDYIRPGETRYIEVPVYKTSEIILVSEDKQNDLVKIVSNKTNVTPFPGNVITRDFEILKVILISGTLIDESSKPIINQYFETGNEPAYTDNNGDFIVEMPVSSKGSKINFITNNKVCSFDVSLSASELIIEVGKISCESAGVIEIDKIRNSFLIKE